jgi:hypothetical protein
MTTATHDRNGHASANADKLPRDTEAERQLLASILLEPDILPAMRAIVGPLDFFDTAYRALFSEMDLAAESGEPLVDAVLCQRLKAYPEFRDGGAAGFLLEIAGSTATAAHAEHFARKVHDASGKRRAVELFESGRIGALNGQPLESTLSKTAEGLDELRQEFLANEQRYRIVTAAELDAAEYTREYHIPDILVAGDLAMIGGPEKALKTSFMVDMFIALAAGGNFLGMFPVTQPCRTLLFSGESGLPNLQDISRRVCRKAGYSLAELNNYILSPDLPLFDNDADLTALERVFEKYKPDVSGFDPMMLCVGGTDSDAGNLFIMGKLLRKIYDLCEKFNATPIIAHHTTTMQLGTIPKLSNLAWSGFKQAAGQWILLNRREEYVPGSGDHRLMMVTGGRAGHNILRAVDIQEGLSESLEGRYWHVDVTRVDEARIASEQRKADNEAAQRQERLEADRAVVCRVLAKHPAGLSKTMIGDLAGISIRRWPKVFAAIFEAGDLEPCNVMISNHKKPIQGYRLNTSKVS